MLTTITLIMFALSLVLAVYFVFGTFHLRRQTRLKKKDIQWALSQLGRALVQIESDDEDTILAGLQTISALNHPLRLRSLARIAELSHSDNVRIARQAKDTIDKIGRLPEALRRAEKDVAQIAS